MGSGKWDVRDGIVKEMLRWMDTSYLIHVKNVVLENQLKN